VSVYCEPRTDTEVLDEIGDAERVFVLGCPSCANMSYALEKELPVYKLTFSGIKAVCTGDEMRRVASLIAGRGAHVDSWCPNFPGGLCALEEGARRKLASRCQDADTIVTLSCETGRENVEGILRGKHVVGGMNARGLLAAVTKRKMGTVLVDKETVRIKKFEFE
jgi:hypothetical protein